MTEDFGETVRKWLRSTMETYGLNANQWAKMAGVSPTTITRALNPGVPFVNSAKTLSKLAGALEIKGPLEVICQGKFDEPPWRDELTALRGSIDNIDAALVHMLAERFKCTQKVGRLKARYSLPPADPRREAEQIARLRALAEAAHLDPAFAEKFLNFIVQEVIRHHEALART